MNLPHGLLNLLACPDCRGPLLDAGTVLSCHGCSRGFATVDGILQLLPAALTTEVPTDAAWSAWAGALNRLVAWRARTWTGAAASTEFQRTVNMIQTEFFTYCRLAEAQGIALDVGCGSADIAMAFPVACRYVGVDPLPLPRPGGPAMVRGVGERLPFREAVFDLVLTLETLDHCQSPACTIAEILRVLKSGGSLCVEQYVSKPGWRERLARGWRGSPAPGRPAPSESPKVTLLDAPDLLALIRPAFAEVMVGWATEGSHVFLAARGKREGRAGG